MENDPDGFEVQILTLIWLADLHAPKLNAFCFVVATRLPKLGRSKASERT
jgi:hypothetical protein